MYPGRGSSAKEQSAGGAAGRSSENGLKGCEVLQMQAVWTR